MNRELKLADPDRVEARQFWKRLQKDPVTGCWNWTGSKLPKGYSKFRLGGSKGALVYVHRWAYARFVGTFPEHLTIDHTCKNTSCVNPEHLEPVTTGVNCLRGQGPAARNAKVTHCPKGHAYTVGNTFVSKKNGSRRCRACGRENCRRYRQVKSIETAPVTEEQPERLPADDDLNMDEPYEATP
jgi:hypothetical protein